MWIIHYKLMRKNYLTFSANEDECAYIVAK